jgi:hypothetical protein
MIHYVRELLQLQKYDLIVNVSYGDYFGRTTHKGIKEILKTLRNVVDVSKEQNDGSQEIKQAIYAKGLDINNCKLEIVGVNTDACVRDTVAGLFYNTRTAELAVHRKGTATNNGVHYRDWALFKVMQESFFVNII